MDRNNHPFAIQEIFNSSFDNPITDFERNGPRRRSASPLAHSYRIVCNHCKSGIKYSDFHDFMEHAKEYHSNISLSAIGLVCVANDVEPKDDEQVPSISDVRSEDITPSDSSISECNESSSCSITALPSNCVMQVIDVLNKCYCLWHKQSRKRMSFWDRYFAFHLVWLKLKEYCPDVPLRSVPKVVQHLKSYFLDEWKTYSGREQHSSVNADDAMFRKLRFLTDADNVDDVNDLVISKLCAFCERICATNTELWLHMKDAHVPSSAKQVLQDCQQRNEATELQRLKPQIYQIEVESAALTILPRKKRKIVEPSNSNNEPLEKRPKPTLCITQSEVSDKGSQTDLETNSIELDFVVKPSSYFMKKYSDKFLLEFIRLYRSQPCVWDENEEATHKDKDAAFEILLRKYQEAEGFANANMRQLKIFLARMRNFYERMMQSGIRPYRWYIWKQLSFVEQGRARSNVNVDVTEDESLYCKICERQFKRPTMFIRHNLKFHPPTECKVCRTDFKNADSLKNHLLSSHLLAKWCPICHDREPDWKSLTHMSMHFFHNKCPVCATVMVDSVAFQEHKSKCIAQNRYKCTHCDAGFGGKLSLRRHSKLLHNDSMPFKCNQCNHCFEHYTKYQKHRQMHKNKRGNRKKLHK